MSDSQQSLLEELFETLFPICRSIAGPGIRASLECLARHMPLSIEGVSSGSKVLDWTVPDEWELKRARLFAPNGETVLDTNNCNLHVLNFSEKFSGEMPLDALQAHLYSSPIAPDAVPYVTSYYAPRWGMCLSERQRNQLPPGQYKVEIDTVVKPGELNYGVCELPGDTDELVLLTSYLCHPSMANNELSGPLALLRLWQILSARPNRRYTYRFLLIPETIGSIVYLSRHGDELQRRLYAGMVLTCLGGPSPTVSFKLSRRDWTDHPSSIDTLAKHLARREPSRFAVRAFTPTGGSDERQFCSPGFNLPVIQAARTIYGAYDSYHTSADDLEFMTITAVEKSARAIGAMLGALEIANVPLRSTLPYGEPQLGRRGLYPSLNGPMTNQFSNDTSMDARKALNHLLCLLSLADGSRTLMEIAEKLEASVLEIEPIARHLLTEGILEEVAA